jgi:sigma-B regulation protein RsbU (phosphoserine phosphatase)
MNKKFLVSIEDLYQMLEFVREQVAAAEIDATSASRIELAVEETLINVISYSGLNPPDQLDINILPDSSKIQIIISDWGIPFNPLSKANKEIDCTIPLENREVGGFGIHLIVNMMDTVEYRRENNQNILTLTKYKYRAQEIRRKF